MHLHFQHAKVPNSRDVSPENSFKAPQELVLVMLWHELFTAVPADHSELTPHRQWRLGWSQRANLQKLKGFIQQGDFGRTGDGLDDRAACACCCLNVFVDHTTTIVCRSYDNNAIPADAKSLHDDT